MSQITLARALSLKKRFVGDADRLAKLVVENNSHRADNTPEYDAEEVLQKYINLNGKLIAIKTAISTANAPIQGKIFKLAELKSYIQTLRKIPTKSGKHMETVGRYGSDPVDMEFKCAITRTALDEMIAATQDDIDALQAELDAFNAVTKIEFED
jgi:hypothetical protein